MKAIDYIFLGILSICIIITIITGSYDTKITIKKELQELKQQIDRQNAKIEALEAAIKRDKAIATPAGLLMELKANKVPYPELWVKVAKLETGHFTSQICLDNKNLFGLRMARHPLVIGTQHGYDKFRNYAENVQYLAIWCKMYPRFANEDGIAYLKRRQYNPNEAYYEYLRTM